MMRSLGVFMVLAAFSWLPDCKGDGEPGAFEKFVTPFPYKPGEHAQMCSPASDGKRFWLDGYLQLPTSLSISDGKTRLDFYPRVDGNGKGTGRSISVDVTSPGDIDDLWASATGKKSSGFRSQKAEIDPNALRINAKNGVAGARDKLRVTFDVNAIKQYQTGQITTCLHQFVKAERI
jgi:hypothetical protein